MRPCLIRILRPGCLAAACHCGDDADLVSALRWSVEPVQIPHVLAVHVDVYEVTNLAVFSADPGLDPGVSSFQGVDDGRERARLNLNAVCVAGQPAEGSRNSDHYCHIDFP